MNSLCSWSMWGTWAFSRGSGWLSAISQAGTARTGRCRWLLPTTKDGPRLYLASYDEENPSQLLHRERTTQEEADRLGAIPREVYGYQALSLTLDMLLADLEAQTAA